MVRSNNVKKNISIILIFIIVFSLISCKETESEVLIPTLTPELTPEQTLTVVYKENAYYDYNKDSALEIEYVWKRLNNTAPDNFWVTFEQEKDDRTYYAIELVLDTTQADFEYDGTYLYEITNSDLFGELIKDDYYEYAWYYELIHYSPEKEEAIEGSIAMLGREKVLQYDEMMTRYDAIQQARTEAGEEIVFKNTVRLLDEQVALLREKGYEARRDGKIIRVICNKQQMMDFPMDTDRFGYHFKFDDGLPD